MGEKKDKKRKLFVIILLLLFGVTAGYIAFTYAKYAGSFTGTGTVEVAKWAFEEDNTSGNLEIEFDKTYDADTLVDGKIAPGTSGKFIIEISNEHSDVGVDYTVSLDSITNAPANLVFTSGSSNLTSGGTITGTLTPGETGKTVEISWEWPYETTGGDAQDTADGAAAKAMTVNLNITGTQVEPTE